GIFRCHTLDFDGFSLPERRNYRDRDALGLKRKLYFVIEVAMPSHDLLFRPIGVRDGFVVDSVLSDGIFLGFLHDFAPRIRRTDVRPIRNRFPSPAGRSTSRAEQRSPSGRESAMGWSVGHWWTRERIGRHETFSTASVPGQKPYAILRFERPAFWPFSSDALAWPKRILF